MPPPPEVFALFGPTAVGKTSVAVALAEELRRRGEDPVAVSADALQVYRGLETLTGAPNAEERARLEHRLVGIADVRESFSVARYSRLAHAEIDALLAAGRRPIVVGGTGLYLRGALSELSLAPRAPAALRARWDGELAVHGSRRLHAELTRRAPWAAERIHPADGRRVVRALELLELGALAPRRGASELWSAAPRHPTRLLGLVREREALYARIEARITAMVADGAADEVRAADAAGASQTARQALGFAELLAGDLEGMRRNTRRYAKRQLTWMRKLEGVEIVPLDGREPAEVAHDLLA